MGMDYELEEMWKETVLFFFNLQQVALPAFA
jgi:hypothetical protein